MRKFVLPDIFGITTELQEFCALLQGDIEILNPYSQKELDFEAESDAYRYFNNATNLVRYTQLLRDKITKNDNPVLLMEAATWWIQEHRLDHFEKAVKILKLVSSTP